MQYKSLNTLLYLDKVELGYGTGQDYKCVLKDITLEEANIVREGYITGQVVAILGRSGRGKSTLFKALTGLVKPHKGQVLISQLSSADTSAAKEVHEGDVGYVDQKYTLFRHKTVAQILFDAQRKTKKTKVEKLAVMDEYLSNWGLTNHKGHYPCELSGGQRQRVAIIEQILSAGRFMVLDEPFSGLDVGNIDSAKKAFDLIQKTDELNTIIFSTHDIKLAVELADSIYVVGYKDGCTDYSTIVEHYDLKKMGLAWQEFGLAHLNLLNQITDTLKKS